MAGESARHKRVRTAVLNLIQLAEMEGEKFMPLQEYSEMSEDERKTVDGLSKNLINLVDALREKPAPAKHEPRRSRK